MDETRDASHRHIDFAVLYRQHYGTMLRLAYRITGDRASAEDACQEVFLKLVTRESPPPTLGLKYLLVATRHTCLDQLREARRLVILEDIHPAPPAPDTDDALRRKALLTEWHDSLTPPQKEALIRQNGGASYEEIAAAMQCGVATVHTHLHRARRKFHALAARERERESSEIGSWEWGAGDSPTVSPLAREPLLPAPDDIGSALGGALDGRFTNRWRPSESSRELAPFAPSRSPGPFRPIARLVTTSDTKTGVRSHPQLCELFHKTRARPDPSPLLPPTGPRRAPG